MNIWHSFLQVSILSTAAVALSACGQPRAQLLPLQYPDGSPVMSDNGAPMLAGYQTYGTAFHTNASAFYENAVPSTCINCAKVGMVVTEPSTVRQVTGVVDVGANGAGSVMTGIGVMNAPQSTLGSNGFP